MKAKRLADQHIFSSFTPVADIEFQLCAGNSQRLFVDIKQSTHNSLNSKAFWSYADDIVQPVINRGGYLHAQVTCQQHLHIQQIVGILSHVND